MRRWSLFIVLQASLVFCNSAAAQGRIELITEEWPPYNYTENGRVTGFSTEIVLRLMRILGVGNPVVSLPGNRAKRTLDSGSRIAYFSMYRNAERENSYKWVGPLARDTFYFYKRKGSSLEIRTLGDAKRVSRIACRNSGLVYSFLSSEGFGNLDVSPAPEGIYEKVLAGRCDLAIGEPAAGVAFLLRKLGKPADALERTAVHILDNDLYIAFSRDVPDSEIEAWQDALDRLKATAEYRALVAAYYH
jgi:polar amino acid transport system substrate-binding protein